MADVSVEFGAKDTGLEQTLKTIQDQLVELDGELKSGTLSFDEINKKMREAAQAEKLHASLGGTKEKLDELGLSFRQTKPSVEEFKDTQKSVSVETEKTATSFKTMAGEMFELRAALENGNLSADEFDKTLRRLNKLEDIKQKMEDFKNSTASAGVAMSQAAPRADELGQRTENAGNKADSAAGIFDSSFAKISAAFTVGNIAAQAFEKIIQTAFDIARAAAQGFSDALDLGGRLNELSVRTGEAAGKLLVLETAFRNSGVSSEQVGVSINKLQKFMSDASAGGERQAGVMDKLGITMADLEGKTPTEQMQIFADKLTAIKDPTDRAATASAIFGDELGGKLLPVLTDFSGNLEDARTKVGSLEQVMDENAATFDAAGETIDAVKGKMAAFAAGIMSETLPALGDLGKAMQGVDAAGLGQQIGQQLNPALTAAADAAKIVTILFDRMGEATAGVTSEITKTQEGSNFLALALVALQNQLNPAIGASNQFKAVLKLMGEESVSATDAQKNTASAIKATGEAAVEAKPKLDALPGAGEELNLEFQNLPQSIETAQGSLLDFNSSLDDSAASTNGIAEGTVAVKDDFSEISSLTAQLPSQNDAFTQSILGTNEQLNLQPGIYAEVFQGISEAQAKEEERRVAVEQAANKLQASVELQIQLNEAIASGNVEEQARVQKLIDAEAAQKRIKELTDQYIASGLGKDEAAQLATNLVNSQIAADSVKKNVEGAKIELNNASESAKTVQQVIDEINQAEMDAPVKGLKERTAEAREKLGDMKDFIGEDLSRMSLSSIVEKLGLDTPALSSSEDQLKEIEQFLTDLGNEDPANVTPEVDVPGSKDNIDQIKEALKETEGTDATPQIDQESVKNQASTARDTIKKDLEQLKAEVTVKPKLDKEALKEEVDMAFVSSKGTQHLSNIDKLVETIKGFVEKIEGKLPMQALAY